MENQHRKITGYRELNETEIDLMNKIKALGPQIENVLEEVRNHVESQRQLSEDLLKMEAPDSKKFGEETKQRLSDATPERFIALAKTDFQTALMYATRAVAQPTFF